MIENLSALLERFFSPAGIILWAFIFEIIPYFWWHIVSVIVVALMIWLGRKLDRIHERLT